MMPEPSTNSVPVHRKGRPFPWFCPNCRCKAVQRVMIPYQCQRFHNGRPITVVLPSLDVPKCGNCGELVFTYDTEEQINLAYREQTDAVGNGANPTEGGGKKPGKAKLLRKSQHNLRGKEQRDFEGQPRNKNCPLIDFVRSV